MKEIPKLSDFPVGKPNDAYAKYFIAQSWLAPLKRNKFRLITLFLNRDAATTGISIMPKKAAVRC